MQPAAQPPQNSFPIRMVGSNVFGRYPQLSIEQTFNMIISDGHLVDAPGYKKVLEPPVQGNGRGIYSSARGDFMIAVIGNSVYRVSGIENNLTATEVFRLSSFFGNVTIEENLASQIAICDGQDLWIYNYISNTAQKATLPLNPETGNPILPGYVTYHDTYFIIPDKTSHRWYLSAPNNGLSWNWGASGQPVNAIIQTKPDKAVAVLRAPGQGNMIMVFGENVVEMWYNNGNFLFPYQRSNSISIDYGCLNNATIAAMDDYIAWLGTNEKSGPVIMVSFGSGFQRVSTDGIDYRLQQVVEPELSYGFIFKLDGHVFYQLTFYGNQDNFTLLYDFNTQAFFYLTDENMNYHIAERVAFFNNTYYFVSIRGGNLYELSSRYTYYDYTTPSRLPINPNTPRIYATPKMRVCNTISLPDSSMFVPISFTFTTENGEDPFYKEQELQYLCTQDGKVLTVQAPENIVGDFLSTQKKVNSYEPKFELAISKDGGESFGSFSTKIMNPYAQRRNRVTFFRFGRCNSFTPQVRIWTWSRVAISDGIVDARISIMERMP